MIKDEKIAALKPLKSQFNKRSKQIDRILRYKESDREVINSNRGSKMMRLLAEMRAIFSQMLMIVHTPAPPANLKDSEIIKLNTNK